MFTLLGNLYQFLRNKRERRLTFVLLGLDNAGKTTLLKALQGDSDQDVTPTFGFGGTTILKEGHYTLSIYDVGGGKQIRRIWKTYLPEVHGVIFVVDASDTSRFEESRSALEQTLADAHISDKPLLVFANKQDLPTAATAPQVASALGLASPDKSKFNILPCIAKSTTPECPDSRIQAGLKWLVSGVDAIFSKLNPRVLREAEAARTQEEKRKKEREERAKKLKEERMKLLQAEDNTAKIAFQDLNSTVSPSDDPLSTNSKTDSPIELISSAAKFVSVSDAQYEGSSCSSATPVCEPFNIRAASRTHSDGEREKQRWSHNKILPCTDNILKDTMRPDSVKIV